MIRLLKYCLLSILILIIIFGIVFFLALPPLVDRFANRVAENKHSSAVSKRAAALHTRLWIADLHSDALLWSRNLTKKNARGHVDIPRLIEGNVALQAFTIVSKTPYGLNYDRNDDRSDMIKPLAMAQRWPTETWNSLKSRALFQANKLTNLAAQSNQLFLIKSKSDLLEYIVKREHTPDVTAGFLGVEGAQVLEGRLENVQVLFDAGIRMMAPSHFYDTEVGGSAHGVKKGGLTGLGVQVLRKMERLGMIVDLAHASPQTIEDVLAMAKKPVLVSHTGVRATCDNARNLSNRHIKGIAATGGVIGIAYFPQAICGSDVEAIVVAMQHTARVGGINCVALGSDFDGAVRTPFDTAGLAQLTNALLESGFAEEEIALIMGGNVRRLLLELLPE